MQLTADSRTETHRNFKFGGNVLARAYNWLSNFSADRADLTGGHSCSGRRGPGRLGLGGPRASTAPEG